MKPRLSAIIVAMLFSTSYAANPSTTSPVLTVDQAEKLVAAKVAGVQTAKDVCQKRLEADPAYHSLSSDMANKLDALETARNQGTTQEKLDAGSAYNLARIKLDAVTKKAMQSDAGIAAAEKGVVAARTQLKLATEAAAELAADAAKVKADSKAKADAEKAAKDFDAEHLRKEIGICEGTQKIREDTKINLIIAGESTMEIDKQIESGRDEINHMCKALAAWNDALPPMDDIPAMLKGKTLEEAESLLKTKVHTWSVTDRFSDFSVKTDSFSIYFTIPADGKYITKVSTIK